MRTTLLGEAGCDRLTTDGPTVAEESSERARKRRRPDVPAWARGEIARFHAHVLYELLGLRELIMALPEDEIGRALRLCLSSILVKFMKAGPTAPRDGVEKRIARGIPSRMLADRAVELARGLAALEQRTPAGTAAPEISEGDARALPMAADSAALVLSSPPYAGTYDYAAIHDARFLWLGLSQKKFRRVQLGARTQHVGRRLRRPPGARNRPASWRRSPASFGRAAARCWSWATGSSTAGPRTRPTASRPRARRSASSRWRARRRRGRFTTAGWRRSSESSPRREHLLLLQKT